MGVKISRIITMKNMSLNPMLLEWKLGYQLGYKMVYILPYLLLLLLLPLP